MKKKFRKIKEPYKHSSNGIRSPIGVTYYFLSFLYQGFLIFDIIINYQLFKKIKLI